MTRSTTPGSASGHLLALDYLRGAAALCVMAYHGFKSGVLPSGLLSVDLFFLLSGFVIARSYEARLNDGMSLSDFAVKRIIRLWPMLIAGSLAGGVVAVVHGAVSPEPEQSMVDVARLTVLSIMLIPSALSIGADVFPLNGVVWSLFFEVIANFAYAIFSRRLSNGVLIAIVAASLAALAAGQFTMGGNQVWNFWWGFPRVAFGFFAGVGLHRLWASGVGRRMSAPPLVLSAILVAVLCLPKSPLVNACALSVVFPLMILAGANHVTRGFDAAASRWLGDVSYPLYLLHFPTIYVLTGLAKAAGVLDDATYPILFTAIAALAIAVAQACLKLYDEPVRAAASRLRARRRAAQIS